MIAVAEKLPDFWNLAQQTAADLRSQRITAWDPLIQQIRPIQEQKFIDHMEEIVPGWAQIATLHQGNTALHTFLVFVCCLSLPEYSQMDTHTRQEIEWAAVLHDLDKQLARNDTAHPFRSAAVVALIMPELGFALRPQITKADIETWSKLVMSAQQPAGERMIHDHASLKEIIEGIHQGWGQHSSASRVLKAVLLHQSLPTIQAWASPALLTDAELAYALTLEDMAVLGPLMIADSDSWNIFEEPRFAFQVEIRTNNQETCRRIEKLAAN